jgi:AraC-like DNA-binding protein
MLQTLQPLDSYSSTGLVEQASLVAGEGTIERLSLPNGIQVMINRHRLARDVIATIEGEDLLKFHVQLSGARAMTFADRYETGLSGASTAVLMHEAGVSKLERMIGQREERSVTTMISRERMFEYLDEEQIRMPSALDALAIRWRSSPRLVSAVPTRQEREVVDTILSCTRGGATRRMYLEAKVTELFVLVLDRMQADSSESAYKIRITERDRRQLSHVRDYLTDAFINPPTVHELSRQFGLNRNKLCRGFLTLYGETIFDFCSGLRLSKARQLLTESTATISEIALASGYATASAFTVAFQRYHGHPPTRFRQSSPLRPVECSQ